MKRRIAFMDFDGTITTKDSLEELIKFHKGTKAFYAGILLLSPVLIAFKLRLIRNDVAKQIVLRYFFGKLTLAEFQKKCDAFAMERLPLLIRPKAVQEIERLKAAGVEVVVVSASAENWTKKWCESLSIRNITTRLQTRNDLITGRIEGKNCHGEEKACRIRAIYTLSDFDEIYCYGDSDGDKQMFELGTVVFYKPFR